MTRKNDTGKTSWIRLLSKNKVTVNKMAEENQVQQEPQKVTTKNPKKVEAGNRLAAHNRRKREEKKAQVQMLKGGGLEGPASRVSQYYSTGAVLAVGVIGGLGYYIY